MLQRSKNMHFTHRNRPILKPYLARLQFIIHSNLCIHRHFLYDIKDCCLCLNNLFMKVLRISYPFYRLDALFDAHISFYQFLTQHFLLHRYLLHAVVFCLSQFCDILRVDYLVFWNFKDLSMTALTNFVLFQNLWGQWRFDFRNKWGWATSFGEELFKLEIFHFVGLWFRESGGNHL